MKRFSKREREVIQLLVQGLSNKQIALALDVSVRAVEYHLSHIYTKLGVSTRTEAAVKLLEPPLRESAGAWGMTKLRESVVDESGESVDNGGRSHSRRIPMNKLVYAIGGVLFITVLTVVLVLNGWFTRGVTAIPLTGLPSTSAAPSRPTVTLVPTVSPKEHILDQIRQLAAEYDQAVQAEKKSGDVEFSKDPLTGADIFLFKNKSYVQIMLLNERLWQQINQLNVLYVQIYRDEVQPTPFPTQASAQDQQAYYEQLLSQSDASCVAVGRLQNGKEPTIFVYDVDDGKYHAIGIGDEYARCETYGQMIEEWRTAPLLAKVNKDADMALIRRVLGKPELVLNFQSIGDNGNDHGRNDAIYTDDIGTKYYIDIEMGRLASIQSGQAGFPSRPKASVDTVKSVDELRRLADQFATANSPRFSELEAVLNYQEGSKGDGAEAIYFFDWRYTSKNWSGTDWAMMPPFLQIGMLSDGQIVTYFDTLDLF